MGIKHIHTTIDYKELIESQANTIVKRGSSIPNNKQLGKQKSMVKTNHRTTRKRS